VLEVELLLTREVEETARGADDDVDALLEGLDLRLVRPAAVDGENAYVTDLARGQQVVRHLGAQLARRDDDEGLRGVGELLGLGPARLDVRGDGDALEEREAEAQRLAGAGLGLADDVGAGQGNGERHLLDGEGTGDADGLEGFGGLGKDPEVSESSQGAASSVYAVRGERGGRVGTVPGTSAALDQRAGWHGTTADARALVPLRVPPHSPYALFRTDEEGCRVGADRATDRASSFVRPVELVELRRSTQRAHYHHTPESRICDGRFGHVVVVTLIDQGLPSRGERAIVRFMTTPDNAPDASAENTGVAAQDWAKASVDPQYRAAVVDLLGALAYGELAAFERLAEDAKLAPTLADKAELAKMASAEFHHFEQLRDRLTEIGAEPTQAMEPFVAALDGFHKQTAPSDWLEGLVKAYVGDSIASDFYREVAARLDSDTRGLVLAVLDDTGHASFAVEKVRAAIDADPRVGGRLALWARRLMGEALSQSQRVVADRDALSTMLVGGVADGFDLAEVGRMFSRITEAHTKRMAALGLAA
jgi:hypothetical protein